MEYYEKERMRRVLEDVERERERQHGKWGTQTHSPIEWLAILAEEFGEVAHVCVDLTWTEGYESVMPLELELIHTAAVAVAFLEDIHRRRMDVYATRTTSGTNTEGSQA